MDKPKRKRIRLFINSITSGIFATDYGFLDRGAVLAGLDSFLLTIVNRKFKNGCLSYGKTNKKHINYRLDGSVDGYFYIPTYCQDNMITDPQLIGRVVRDYFHMFVVRYFKNDNWYQLKNHPLLIPPVDELDYFSRFPTDIIYYMIYSLNEKQRYLLYNIFSRLNKRFNLLMKRFKDDIYSHSITTGSLKFCSSMNWDFKSDRPGITINWDKSIGKVCLSGKPANGSHVKKYNDDFNIKTIYENGATVGILCKKHDVEMNLNFVMGMFQYKNSINNIMGKFILSKNSLIVYPDHANIVTGFIYNCNIGRYGVYGYYKFNGI